jgi:REP element-mobilizing transposase RayT
MARAADQLALTLTTRPRWSGRRAGAGRKRRERPQVRHLSRNAFKRLPVHVTVRVLPDVPSLRNVRIVRRIEHTFANGCDRSDFRLIHYSLQGNHTHLIVEATDQLALGRGMKAIGARLARAVNRVAHRTGRVFADRYHHHVLRTPREVHHALRYVLLNARRHARKAGTAVAAVAQLDPASSGRWFDGWKRAVLPQPAERRSVAAPRLWLLTKGWRRHGLLDPADVPG